MVLDLPNVVETEPVGQFDLLKSFSEQLLFRAKAPWARQLEFLEQTKSHDSPPARASITGWIV